MSIRIFGFNCPVLVDARGNVIAGHARLAAARELEWTQVPTIMLEHLTPTQVEAYRIADNRLSDLSAWDNQFLAEILQGLWAAELDFDLTATGFDLPECDFRIQEHSLYPSDDGAVEPNLSEPAINQVGDRWLLGVHRIVCGDAFDPAVYELLLDSDRAQLVVSDPPYNRSITRDLSHNGRIQHGEFAMASGEMSDTEFHSFLTQSLARMRAVSVEGALLYIFMDWRGMRHILAAGALNSLELKNLVVWNKGRGGMGSFYRSQHELIFVFKSGTAQHTNNIQLGRFGRNRTNVWDYPGANTFTKNSPEGDLSALHPTVKPVSMIADALLDASVRGGIVLDPFLGSGTTIIAAEQTGRRGFGIEIDPHYVDVAVRRWQRLTGQSATHALSGCAFDSVQPFPQPANDCEGGRREA